MSLNMEIIKIIGIALTAVIIIIVIKQYKPEFSVYISLIASVLIMFIFMDKLGGIVAFISDFSNRISRKPRILKNTCQNHWNCHFNGICGAVYVKMWVKMQLALKSI